jgi:hypothetical protein
VSYQVIIDLIAATTTDKGLTVRCEHDTATYAKGIPCRMRKWLRSISSVTNFTASGTIRSGRTTGQIARLIPDKPEMQCSHPPEDPSPRLSNNCQT